MLNWAQPFSIFLFLDSNSYASTHGRYECLLGVGWQALPTQGDVLRQLQDWHDAHKDWLLGHICYDYKNELEPSLRSDKQEYLGFAPIQFFCPETVCYIDAAQTSFTVETLLPDAEAVLQAILSTPLRKDVQLPEVQFAHRTGRDAYLQDIERLQTHITDGDCYEINYCTEGYAQAEIAPLAAFNALNALSPAPFAAMYKDGGERYLLCASPERYLQKQGSTLRSQPIKGTAKRGEDAVQDEQQKQDLQQSIKERAENVMIVDLVRNDLARCCEVGSVAVEELFGIYTYPQVHQMISTVSGRLRGDANWADAIRYSFPMGSMTGAPKIKVMELIERYEEARRELFSGTVGYISPQGDMDFNVIIRSLFYNAATHRLSYQAGGAITADSVPGQEWEEMRLKAWALERIFGA